MHSHFGIPRFSAERCRFEVLPLSFGLFKTFLTIFFPTVDKIMPLCRFLVFWFSFIAAFVLSSFFTFSPRFLFANRRSPEKVALTFFSRIIRKRWQCFNRKSKPILPQLIKYTSVSLKFVSSLLAWCHPVYINCYVTILESRPLFKKSVVTSYLLTIFYKILFPSIFSKLTRFCTRCLQNIFWVSHQFLLQLTRHLTFLPRLNTLLLH